MTDKPKNIYSAEESERQIIGSIFCDPTPILYLCQKANLQPDAFFSPAYQTIYRAILDMAAMPKVCIDTGSVAHWLKTHNSAIPETDLLLIIDRTPTSATCGYHIEQVIEFQRRRSTIKTLEARLDALKSDANRTTAEHIGALYQALMPLEDTKKINITKLEDHKAAKIEQWTAARSVGYVGIPSCFSELNKLLGGWRKCLGIIGAYRGTGKSTVIRQDALWQAKQGFKVAVFSLEDPADIAAASIVGNHANTCVFHLDIGDARENQLLGMAAAWDHLKDLPLWIINNAYSLDQITATAHLLKQRYGLDIIYVDHIQYISPYQLPGMNRNNTMAVYSAHLSRLAKTLDCAIVAASQFSRLPEQEDRKPRLSDFRDSGTIEQDCRQALILYRHKDADIYGLEVAKNNYGVSGKEIELERHGEKQRFEPASTRF